jgi:pilus assembly protein FimV
VPEPVSEPVATTNLDTPVSTDATETGTTAGTEEITKDDIWGDSLANQDTTDSTTGTETVADPTTATDGTSSEPVAGEPTVTPISEPVTTAPEPIASTPVAEPSFLELYWPWLAGGGGVLLLLGLLAALRKKKPAENLDLRDDGQSQVFDDTAHQQDNLGFPADMRGTPTPPPFEAFDADPEMALRSGIEADPDDLQCHLELLRLFHRRRDADAFEDAAQAMLARVADPALSAEWQEARNMGESLVPNSALFARLDDFSTLDLPAVGGASTSNDDGLGDLDFGSFDSPTPAPAPSLAKSPAPAPAPAAPDSFDSFESSESPAFDFNLDLDGPTRQVEPVRVDSPAPAPAPAPTPSSTSGDDLSFDFNFDLDAPADPSPAPAPAPAPVYAAPAPAPVPSFEPPTLDLPDFDFSGDIKPVDKMSFEPTEIESPVVTSQTSDLSEPEIIREPELPAFDDALFSSDDAVGTKLDLARAYLDMGDPDGARSMLEEVMAEGDDAQRNEARELLGRLG